MLIYIYIMYVHIYILYIYHINTHIYVYIFNIYIYIHTRRKRRATAPPLHPTPSASNGWVQEFKVSWIQGFKVPNDISLSLLTHTALMVVWSRTWCHPKYGGTSPMRKRTPLGPYRRPTPRVLGWF